MRHGLTQPGSSAAVPAVSDTWQCLPGNALIELNLRCGLRQRVPVLERFKQVIPGGRTRAGAIRGGSGGSPMGRRMPSIGAASLMKASRRMSAPQLGQSDGSDW